MVRLHRTAGDKGIGPTSQGIRYQELEFARLVAPRRQPCLVIALDPQLGEPEVARQLRERLQRCRSGDPAEAIDSVEPGDQLPHRDGILPPQPAHGQPVPVFIRLMRGGLWASAWAHASAGGQ